MSDVTVDQKQLLKLELRLKVAGKSYKKGKVLLLKKIGVLVQGLARKYCPESPTLSMYAAMNQDGVTTRDASSITSGSLMRSITHEVGVDFVSIFVPSNSPGGKYAEKIHDKKGVDWQNRGPRTKQKGSKADDKFIDRAGDKASEEIDALIDNVLDDMIRKF